MDIGEQDRLIAPELLKQVLDLEVNCQTFNGLGDIHASHNNNLLTYIKDDKFVNVIIENPCISGVICTEDTAKLIPERINKIIHADPNYAFFTLVNYFGENSYKNTKSMISSVIPNNVSVSEFGVVIGKNVYIEPNVTILAGVRIDDNVVIRAGAVIGLDTFQHQRTSRGIISPKHDGILHIKSNVEIGACSTISRGFSYRNTMIGSNSKLDAQVYVAHGTIIGDSAIICAGARVMGHVNIGENVFIGPSSVISSRVRIGNHSRTSIGSVVTKDVLEHQVVSGNFAIPHEQFIKNMKSQIL